MSDQDFKLIYRGEEYPIKSHTITSLSPKVSKLVFSPNPQNFLEIPPVEGDMNEFIALASGKEVKLDKYNAPFLNFVANFLEIVNLKKETAKVFEDNFSLEDLFNWAEKLLAADQDASNEIDTVAANFMRLGVDAKNYSCELIEAVLSSTKLNCTVLYKTHLIDYLIKANHARYGRLSSLIFTGIKNIKDASFALNATTLDLNQARDAMKLYLRSYKPPKEKKKFLLSSSKSYCGAIHYVNSLVPPSDNLIGANVTNIAENSMLYLAAKSCFNARFSVNNIIPTSDPSLSYCSLGTDDESITIFFKRAKLRVTEYLIQSYPGGSKGICPFSWKLEGSYDGTQWIVLHDVRNNRSLHGSSVSVIFKVPTSFPPMHYFRLTQLDAVHTQNKKMFIGLFDLFGELYF
jgi:hypothetical protein